MLNESDSRYRFSLMTKQIFVKYLHVRWVIVNERNNYCTERPWAKVQNTDKFIQQQIIKLRTCLYYKPLNNTLCIFKAWCMKLVRFIMTFLFWDDFKLLNDTLICWTWFDKYNNNNIIIIMVEMVVFNVAGNFKLARRIWSVIYSFHTETNYK